MKGSLLAVLATIISFNATAALITTGDLVHDTDTKLITGGGNTYLAWDVGASWDYATTLANTAVGGAYEDFRIANQTEAFEFFNLANTGTDVLDNAGTTHRVISAANGQKRFGNNYNSAWSYAWFMSDESNEVGFIESYSNYLKIYDNWSSIASSDYYSAGRSGYLISWLLISDTPATSVSEPSPLALFLAAIAAITFVRKYRKS